MDLTKTTLGVALLLASACYEGPGAGPSDPEADPEARLAAFRLRFRPGATGPEEEADRRIAAAAATVFHPVG